MCEFSSIEEFKVTREPGLAALLYCSFSTEPAHFETSYRCYLAVARYVVLWDSATVAMADSLDHVYPISSALRLNVSSL